MKIVHIEGGLGNQMAGYAVYLATMEANPEDDVYIDTYLYDVSEAHSTISMWNGYELGYVFGLALPDIRSLFTEKQVAEQIEFLKQSKFWEHGWNYSEVFIDMMKNYGIYLENAYGKVGDIDNTRSIKSFLKTQLKMKVAGTSNSRLGYEIKRVAHLLYRRIASDCGVYLIQKRTGNYYYDLTLDFMKSNYLHHAIGDKVRDTLEFVNPCDQENLKYMELMRANESVSVHIRRTDYLQFNEDCYKYDYFPKAIKYIKKQCKNLCFFVFSDDLSWCMDNKEALGFESNDNIIFVDVNKGKASYRDMQLMSNCKHNIATKSSFGWWGSFLNRNPKKITCCQIGSYVVKKQF